ncbi:MAG: hypothetical protein HRT36_07275 [Alphaproteobacteria bacterium]|nr:hypothetical protein [Alphaproteobacteria bacterium]
MSMAITEARLVTTITILCVMSPQRKSTPDPSTRHVTILLINRGKVTRISFTYTAEKSRACAVLECICPHCPTGGRWLFVTLNGHDHPQLVVDVQTIIAEYTLILE